MKVVAHPLAPQKSVKSVSNSIQIGLLVPFCGVIVLILCAWATARQAIHSPSDGVSLQPHHLEAKGIRIPNDWAGMPELRAGDLVVQVDDRVLSNWELNLALAENWGERPAIGDVLHYRVLRGNQEHEVDVELAPSSWQIHWSEWVVIAVNVLVGLYIFIRKPLDPDATIFLFVGITFTVGVVFGNLKIGVVELLYSPWGALITIGRLSSMMMLTALTAHFGFVFPSAHWRLQKRPWLIILPYLLMLTLFMAGVMLLRTLTVSDLIWLSQWVQSARVVYLVNFGLFFLVQVAGYTAQNYAPDRRALAVLLVGVSTSILFGISVAILPGLLFGQTIFSQKTAVTLAMIPLPFAFLVAILRFRLFDIDLRYRFFDIEKLLQYSFVYLTLTSIAFGIYVTVTGLITQFLHIENSLFVSLIAMSIIVVAIYPIYQSVQRFITRLLFGVSNEPMYVLDEITTRLSQAVTPQETLNGIVETLADLLRLPYVAIAIRTIDQLHIVASQGKPTGKTEAIQLIYQSEEIGELRVAPRSAEEPLNESDYRLFDQIAAQVSTTAYAVRLTSALSESHIQLVAAREDERRRLQRDLHDGIGPLLASHLIKIGAVQTILGEDAAEAKEILGHVEEEIATGLKELRTLVYALRPPEIEQRGLPQALDEYIDNLLLNASDLIIVFNSSNVPTAMSAATEVALYRIVQTALDNVVRHSKASRCTIEFTKAETYMLIIQDNGIGLPDGYHAGVGVTSMRERAHELEGTFTIQAQPSGGTAVTVHLPINHFILP